MCPEYDTKTANREDKYLEIWGMSTPSLQSHPCPLGPRVVVPIRVLSMGQIETFTYLLYLKPFNYVQTNMLWLILE